MSDLRSMRRRVWRVPAPRPLRAAAAAALCTVGLMAACDGDNMFSGSAERLSQGPPAVTAINVPSSIGEGARLDVRVRAIAPAGLTRVDIRYRGAVNEDQSFTFESRRDTVVVDASLQLPAQLQDSVLRVEAFATDLLGRVSEVAVRTIQVLPRHGPIVTATLLSSTVSVGDTLRLRVNARDAFGLTQLGFAIVTADGDTIVGTPVRVPASGIERDTIFAFLIPQHLRPGTLTVVGFALNTAQLQGVSSPLAVSLTDLLPPNVTILRPQHGGSHPLSDSLLVRVAVSDSGGVAELRIRGVAIRGGPLTNTVVVDRYREVVIPFPQPPATRLPTDTVVQRFIQPTGEPVSEPVFIIATARDAAGNISADTVQIQDGPRIEIIEPPDGLIVGVQRTLNVRVAAADRVAGLDRIELRLTGVRQETISRTNLGGAESVELVIPINTGSAAGTLTIEPRVWNRLNVVGAGQPITLQVSAVPPADTEPPQVMRRVETADRIELTDPIRIVVRATDGVGSGVARMGAVVVARPEGDLPARTLHRQSELFDPPATGTQERTFEVRLGEAYTETEIGAMRAFSLEVHAFAVDAATPPNCGAAVGEVLSALPCEPVMSGGSTFYVARGATPVPINVTVVRGYSARMPEGGRIADAVVDTARRRVYLSNIERGRVESFDLATRAFGPRDRGRVGAAPWGLAISNDNSVLFVANSGGTNISVVDLYPQGNPNFPNDLVEDVARRILTPDVRLIDVSFSITDTGLRYTVSGQGIGYSDRPQFIAQHASGLVLYSTLPTPAARDGTIRYVDTSLPNRPQVYLLHRKAVTAAENSIALASVDSVTVVRAVTEDDRVILFGRQAGTGVIQQSAALPLDQAIVDLRSKGVPVEDIAGVWNRSVVALSDTTYVATSRDRQVIAFGEGARAPFGRVLLCCEIFPGTPVRVDLVSEIATMDLIENAAERVFGLDLNQNGSLGVARGTNSAYFFTGAEALSRGAGPLRLQGEFRSGVAGGAGGAAIHPQHADVLTQNPDHRLAFVATPNRSIKIVDALHFYERGEIHIRNNVVGPVRAFLPTDGDNQGLSGDDIILIRLVAVTEGDHIAVIDVRRRDVQN
jgi:hypothetical protein